MVVEVRRLADSSQIFGKRLGRLLDARDIKQVDLAKHLNVSKTTVSRYIKGRVPHGEVLDRIALFFDTSVDFLLGRTDDPSSRRNVIAETSAMEVGYDLKQLILFLRGKKLTGEDVEAVKDLLEVRRLRREREEKKD
jgi:transcriptional regulator with XRE-family HTH domain